ncbi:NADH-quinone oxidoreductase subunit NuoG [Microbulbifer hainanensis]|uniref:NADH-quinone oxidoreductase subunit NuoG n=1 Tax=Microbulbifer hainanensis TaxID=2735675 RepID=UPI00186831E6|nr:NADH-quinone oxidoreductase subunit NuoG [Microbulbifer hainanensis]
MPNITIDGEQYEIEDGQNLLNACLSLGINLPYFCWHPAMGSVGACRQCAVIEYKDFEDQRGKLVMGCMTPIKDGGIYSVSADSAREFRGGVIEDLMTNHPHDCPVCEEGGECHLQDMTEMSGHTLRRYRGTKRTHRNQYLGPFINHEMNRCIACYRCTRFYREYAGGSDLAALGRNNQVYFGREQDGMLESGFSGNLVEVCPTGVFTDKTFSEHFVRKWDLQTAPSICEHCAVGCNTAPGAREPGDGEDAILRRVTNLFNHDINGYFLCDRGRFGYDYVNSEARIKNVLATRTLELIETTAGENEKIHGDMAPRDALQQFADTITAARRGRRRLIGIGSPRSSLENNFALRQLVGAEHYYAGLNARDLQLLHLVDRIQRDPRLYSPTTPQIENADAVLVLGEEIEQTAPRIALAVRQAARNRQKQHAQQLKIPLWQDASVRQLDGSPSPILLVGVDTAGLCDIASEHLPCTAEQTAMFAAAIACRLSGDDSGSPDLPEGLLELADNAAQILAGAERPLIISGCGNRDKATLHGAAAIATALGERTESPCALYLACPEVNSLGIAQLFEPGTGDLEQLAQSLESGEDTGMPVSVVILENDLYRRADAETVEQILAADEVILLDSLLNQTARRADLIFPAAATAESQGSYINSNGTAQRFYAVYEGTGFIQESWRWLSDAAGLCGAKAPSLTALASWRHSTDLSAAIACEFSQMASLADLGPDEDYRIDGLKVARQTHRYSGRTAIHAKAHVAEQPPHADPDAPMAFSMEGIQNAGETPLVANIWSPGWNSNQSIHKFQQEVGGPRRHADGTARLLREPQAMPSWRAPTGSAPRSPAELELVPLYCLYGSDELSARAKAIASVIDEPYAVLSEHDASERAIAAGDSVEIELPEAHFLVRARISTDQPRGTLGVPYGLPGLEELAAYLPGRATLSRLARISSTESGGTAQ